MSCDSKICLFLSEQLRRPILKLKRLVRLAVGKQNGFSDLI